MGCAGWCVVGVKGGVGVLMFWDRGGVCVWVVVCWGAGGVVALDVLGEGWSGVGE